MSPLASDLILALGGVLCGLINVLAGGGSFLTLPLLIFLGLPAATANGTNRLGIVAQNLSAVASFHHSRVLDWPLALWLSLPSCIGAYLGAVVSLRLDEATFRRVLAVLMVVITLGSLLWRPRQNDPDRPLSPRARWLMAAGFFVAGIYGGFVQAGVGFLILAVTSLAGLDLVRGNALKVTTLLFSTLISLVPFLLAGRVDWRSGLVLSVGTLAGGFLGARLTVLKGQRWVQGFVSLAVVGVAVALWFR